MSRRNKLQKFADILTFPNVFEHLEYDQSILAGENGESVEFKEKWKELYFKNDHPITLELACGGGEYTLSLAEMYPNRNFIGVDIKGARIWKGANKALQRDLKNVAFLRTRIELLAQLFGPEEINEIWITFPDPFLRDSKANRRLTASNFLTLYRYLLPKDSVVNLKTDSPELYEFTLETLAEEKDKVTLLYHDDDIYNKALPIPELEFKTHYEHMHLKAKRTIKFVQFKLS